MTPDGVVLTHSGKQHAYRVAAALQRAGVLRAFVTGTYYKPGRFPDRIAQRIPRLDAWLRRRHEPALDPDRVHRMPTLEMAEVAYRLVRGSDQRAAALVARRDRRFDAAVSAMLPRFGARALWGFQGSCAASIERAHALGLATVAEYASIPDRIARQFLREDASAASALHRDADLPRGEPGDPAAAHTDAFVAASTFSARCLAASGVVPGKIHVIPLGVDPARFPVMRRQPKARLEVLFVGKLAWHKGVHHLLEAVRLLGGRQVALTLAGPGVGHDSVTVRHAGGFRALGALDPAGLARALQSADVLAVPSLYEGFGLVILEAMASGLPVIATENSCAPDVIRPGIDGFVVAPRDPHAIAERLEWCAGHRAELVSMGRHAAERAREYSWDRHAERVGELARRVLTGSLA